MNESFEKLEGYAMARTRGKTGEATKQDQVTALIGDYLLQLKQRGRDAPLPLDRIGKLPQSEHRQTIFTLKLMRACWGSRTSILHASASGEASRRAGTEL